MQEVKNLLNQVTAINRKYEGIGRITGEKFNIFKLLGVASSEVRTHSMFLAELLNPKGSHQQDDVFLKLFVERFSVKDFDTASATAEAEFYIGTKTATTGGRIDILVRDKSNRRIIIENKVYAGDQENQLLRYYNYDRGAKLFYLTLNGDAPGDWSTGGKLKETDYVLISYRQHILNWLEDCKKEAVNLPILRETITQYICLTKYLTNQTANYKMQEEIVGLILHTRENFEAFVYLQEVTGGVYDQVVTRLKTQLEGVAEEFGLELDYDIGLNRTVKYAGFSFKGGRLDKYNITIRFEFDKGDTKGLCFGFTGLNKDEKQRAQRTLLKEKFVSTFKTKVYSTDSWPAYTLWSEYSNWDTEIYLKIYKNELTAPIRQKLVYMLEIVESLNNSLGDGQ